MVRGLKSQQEIVVYYINIYLLYLYCFHGKTIPDRIMMGGKTVEIILSY